MHPVAAFSVDRLQPLHVIVSSFAPRFVTFGKLPYFGLA